MDIILKLIIGIAVVFAVFWTVRTKKTFPAIITLGMVAGALFAILPAATLQKPGLYIYMGFVALAFIYGLATKEKNTGARLIIVLMSASIFVYWLWVLNHWHGNEILAPVLVLVTGLAGIISSAKLKNELGFLTILAADAIAIILEHWLKAS
jgi:hypothetical protein